MASTATPARARPDLRARTARTNIDDCSPNPCENGGVCADGVNSFTCACPTGYSGDTCETNIDECAANPCQNGGTCADGVNSLHLCVRHRVLEGTIRARPISTIAQPTPARTAGRARMASTATLARVRPDSKARTARPTSTTARRTPASMAGRARMAVNSYLCECPAGYDGVNCETDMDGCLGDPIASTVASAWTRSWATTCNCAPRLRR
jgi:hypothetical protein